MRDQSLRTHLANLEQQGELIRFDAEIDPDETMSAVAHKTFAELGKACLFDHVKGHPDWRAAAQLVSDRRKWAVALGVAEADVVATMVERVAQTVPTVEVARDRAPCKEVVCLGDEVDLTRIPAMWTSERDPGRYIAAGMCFIKDPDTQIRNVSFHRAQILGPDRTAFLICPRQAHKIFELYQQRGRPMEVAMVVGAHPLIEFAAGFVAPYGTDEMTIAGALLQDPVRMVKCETIDMEVPAEAELIIEGEIFPGERTEEGPFGEVTGTYAQEGSTPLFRVKAVTHRRDPIFHAMQCGLAPSEAHSLIGTTVEMKLWEHLRGVDAGELELLDVRIIGAMSPLMVVVQMRQNHPGQARAALLAALSSPYLHPKFAVAVDEDVNPADANAVLWAIATRVDAGADVERVNATRVFTLDNASPIEPGMSAMYRVGTKMAIDATRPMAGSEAERRRFDRASPQPAADAPRERAQWAAALGVPADGVLGFLEAALRSGLDPVRVEGAPPARMAPHFARAPAPFAAVTIVADPADGRLCLGLTRHHVLAADRLSVMDLPPALAAIHRRCRAAGHAMQATLVIGAEPALLLAAALGTWRRAELGLAGAIGRAPVRLIGATTVPAGAALVVVGEIGDETAPTGRLATVFDTHYDGAAPVLRAHGMIGRPEALHAAGTLEGARALAAETLVASHIRNIEGGIDVLDIRAPMAAGGQVVVVKLRPRLEGQAKTALMGALSGPVNAIKLAIAVDEDVDAGDMRDVFWSVASRTHAEKDVGMIRGLRAHPLDFASPLAGIGAARIGTRWFIDATMPPLTQVKRREDFARAIPKNLAAVDLARFLPKGVR